MNEAQPPHTDQQGLGNNLKSTAREVWRQAKRLFQRANQRQLLLKNREGKTLVSLPLSFALILGFLLLWRASLLLIALIALALILRMQFVVTKDGE